MGIGNQIKKRRIELGYSQDKLAKKMGYKFRSSINKIELGLTDIAESKIIEFAKALDTTPAYLMGWEEKEEIKNEVVQILNGLSESDQQKILAFARGIQSARQNVDNSTVKYSVR